MPFDKLIRQIDHLVAEGTVSEPVICQIGTGTYEPVHCKFFRFRPNLDDLFAEADLVITHGGATVIGLLVARKRFIAVPNDLAAGQHQLHFLERMAKQTSLHWTPDPLQLGPLIAAARQSAPSFDRMLSIADDLKAYLRSAP
jgi:beta-1,4-N-acetylglucosaminyltransferase